MLAKLFSAPMHFTDKGPAIDIMNHLKDKIDDTATLEGKLEKATIYFDEKMILLQDYISKNAIIEKELADGRYSELEKDYREALAEKEKLQDERTNRRHRSLMIKRFIDEVSGFEDLFTEFTEKPLAWAGGCDSRDGQEEIYDKVQERDGSTG